jgi:5-dehydro-2-deoxygluconokinase
VFRVLGAGDGFMSGLLKGWLDGEAWERALTYANACGAFAVSRHGCTPAYPSWEELQFFLARGVIEPALRKDAALEQVHWATNRHGDWPEMRVFAFDHRAQLEEMPGATAEKIGKFKELCLDAALEVQGGRHGYGILCDGRLGRDALWRAAGTGLWIGRPVEFPGARPLRFEPELGLDLGGLGEWPLAHVVKVLCFCHPGDDAAVWEDQIATLTRLAAAARRNRLELLVEVIPSKVAPVTETTAAEVIERIYAAGIWPDWWKLEPMTSAAAWANAAQAITARDPHCRGIVVLGLDAPEADLAESFALAAREPLVKGFAVGRTIFGTVARDWLSERIGDAAAIAEMAARYRRLCGLWDAARRPA